MLKLNNNFGNSQHSTIFLKRCFLKQGLPQFDPPPQHTHTHTHTPLKEKQNMLIIWLSTFSWCSYG